MKLGMCNEFCVDWPIDKVCKLAVDAGFAGIELTPYTMAPTADAVTAEQRATIRKTIADHGLETIGIHWLLAKTEGLSINGPDAGQVNHTIDYYHELIQLCADLGGTRMIHGSPAQRNVPEGESYDDTFDRTVDFFADVAEAASDAGVIVCVEPLARTETNFLTTRDEAVRLIEAVDEPSIQLILDCKAMSDESESIPDLLRGAKSHLRHVHANDANLSYPGSGAIDFGPIMQALADIDYQDWVSIEVFDFDVPPEEIAHEGIRTLKEAMAAATS